MSISITLPMPKSGFRNAFRNLMGTLYDGKLTFKFWNHEEGTTFPQKNHFNNISLMNVRYNTLFHISSLSFLEWIQILSGWINLEKLRVPGVLQRFGITYFIVATSGVLCIDTLEQKFPEEGSKWKILEDCFSLWPRWPIAAIFTAVHCILTFYLPVPGCPTGTDALNIILFHEYEVKHFWPPF